MTKLPIPFNNPRTYPGHSGVDYPQPHGTPFRASGNGTVTQLGRNARGGYFIWVQYDNGPHVGYHHMPSHAGCPRVGTRVSEGTQLGHVGSTGNSTGPHLHSEVAGHYTTDGYWRFFDRNRVVGSRPAQPSPASSGNPFGIPNVRGLQKIAKLYGYRGAIDNVWGGGSKAGFAQFLRRNWGYAGNDVLGPIMWRAIARWLRSRWGYVGNDVPGPVMRAALQRAEEANFREL